jgi:DNA-binding beta-propeller fold protein YncE
MAVAAGSCLLAAGGCGGRPALVSPSCTRAVATAPTIRNVRTTLLKLAASPFGVVSSAGFSFVTVGGYTGLNELWVYRDGGLQPRLVRRIRLPVRGAAGEAVTPDGRLVLVAAGSGITVVDASKARRPRVRAVLGSLQAVRANAGTGALDPRSAIEVAVTPDGRYAFVSLEYLGKIAVFDLRAARASDWKHSGLRGLIPIGLVNVGLAVSPDGQTLYATRAITRSDQLKPLPGTLDLIDVKEAARNPAAAEVRHIAAGCDPVRVLATPDGRTVWVTARGSNALLGFSASRLAKSPRKALDRDIRVGEAPVGLALVEGGRRIVVLNSNRFGVVGVSAHLSLVDAGRGKLIGAIRAGAFPREAATGSDGKTLLVTNWSSQELEAVQLGALP